MKDFYCLALLPRTGIIRYKIRYKSTFKTFIPEVLAGCLTSNENYAGVRQ
jgi:hypothetical protein